MKRPVTGGGAQAERAQAAYFVEHVRQELENSFGAEAIYESGLQVATTLDDAQWERDAEIALERGLCRIDKRRLRYRRPSRNVGADGTVALPVPPEALRPGDIVPAVVARVPTAGRTRRLSASARGKWSCPRRIRLDASEIGARPLQARRVVGSGRRQRGRRGAWRPHARAAATHRGRGGGPGQPDRANPGAHRRPELCPQQVQPRHAGAPAKKAKQ